MGKEKQKQDKGRGQKRQKSCMRCYRDKEKCTQLSDTQHRESQTMSWASPPRLQGRFGSGMDRLRQEGGKGMLQRVAGHRQQFWAPRRVAALL